MSAGVLPTPRGRRGDPVIAADGFDEQFQQALSVLEEKVPGDGFSVGLCGCRHGVGVTSVALGFFEVLAGREHRPVMLAEANLRSPSIADALGLERDAGLMQYASGDVELERASVRCGESQARLMVAGTPGATWSTAVPAAVERLKQQVPRLLVDLPPAPLYADAPALGRHLDGIILVLEAERDRWEVAKLARDHIEGVGGRVLGVVLNRKPFHIPRWIYSML